MIVTDGYLDTILSATISCEGILSGDVAAFEALVNDGSIKKIVGEWHGPFDGMRDGKPERVTADDHERYVYQMNTAFFTISNISEDETLAAPLLSQAKALRLRIATALETGEVLNLTDDETVSAGKVLEFVMRMKMGQFERITDAFRDAQVDDTTKQMVCLQAIEHVVLKLKNALGYANSGSLNVRSAGQYSAWELVKLVKTNPDTLASPSETLELAS